MGRLRQKCKWALAKKNRVIEFIPLAEANGYEFKVKDHNRLIYGTIKAKMQMGFSQKN